MSLHSAKFKVFVDEDHIPAPCVSKNNTRETKSEPITRVTTPASEPTKPSKQLPLVPKKHTQSAPKTQLSQKTTTTTYKKQFLVSKPNPVTINPSPLFIKPNTRSRPIYDKENYDYEMKRFVDNIHSTPKIIKKSSQFGFESSPLSDITEAFIEYPPRFIQVECVPVSCPTTLIDSLPSNPRKIVNKKQSGKQRSSIMKMR